LPLGQRAPDIARCGREGRHVEHIDAVRDAGVRIAAMAADADEAHALAQLVDAFSELKGRCRAEFSTLLFVNTEIDDRKFDERQPAMLFTERQQVDISYPLIGRTC
jgi:hypothetical protein